MKLLRSTAASSAARGRLARLPVSLLGAVASLSVLSALAGSGPARAADSAPAAKAAEPAVQLTPFEVQADSDTGYGALNSNSITGFRVPLNKTPLSADILDETFMKDVGGDDYNTLLQNYTAGASFAPAADASNPAAQPMDIRSNNTVLRGMRAPFLRRDTLMLDVDLGGGGYGSNFDVERIEIINGPQSLLYGDGGGGGIVNIVSKQAHFDRKPFGSVRFQYDTYHHDRTTVDYGVSTPNVAARFAAINQFMGTRRENIGGRMSGYYGQLAFKLPYNNTLRLTSKYMILDQFIPVTPTLNTGSAANDARNGQNLGWLLATHQLGASASGPSGAGVIDNGNLNWDNLSSYGGQMQSDNRHAVYDALTLDTKWSEHFSTQLMLGYTYLTNDNTKPSLAFLSPNNTSNPLKVWAMQVTGGRSDSTITNRWQKGIRYSGLLTNDFFGRRVHSQTMFGLEATRYDLFNAALGLYQADANWNVIVNPAVTTNSGRTPLPTAYWSIANGPVKYPLFNALDGRVVFNGVNYLRQMSNLVDRSLVSAANPLGTTSTNSNDTYSFGHTVNKGAYLVNYADWMDGKMTTIGGFRATEYNAVNTTGVTRSTSIVNSKTANFNVGVLYRLTSRINGYVTASDSYRQPLTPLTGDPYGAPPDIAHALGGEAGLKFDDGSGRISGTLAYFDVKSKKEAYTVDSGLVSEINPTGLNGTLGSTVSTTSSVDQRSRGLQLAATATHSRHWRSRLSLAYIDAKLNTTRSYGQLYNDQFYANAQGQVTYKDGTPVYVTPTFNARTPTAPATTAGATPLTIAAMSDPTSLYYANPAPITAQINAAANVATVLKAADPQHGPILTGAAGLPISQLQIRPNFTPPGTIAIAQAGDRLTGSPKYAANFTSVYTFSDGWARGFRVGGNAALGWDTVAYYYYPGGVVPNTRKIAYQRPTAARFDLITGYEYRLRKTTLSVQMNVNNLFNHYDVLLYPNPTAGWAGPNNAGFNGQPRMYVWSVGLDF